MGKSIKKMELAVLMIVGSVLILVMAYFLLWTKLTDTTKSIKLSNASLQREVNDLKAKERDIKKYEQATEDMLAEIEIMLNNVPSRIEEEDQVMFARNLELAHEVTIKSISINEGAGVYTLNESKKNPEDAGKVLRQNTISLNCTTGYAELKNLINGLKDSSKRVSIEQASFTASDDSGTLSGGVVVNMYYLDGGDKAYAPEEIPSVPMSTTNIFGQ